MDKEQIVQIIPATGWWARYRWPKEEGYERPLVCWALVENGDVVGVKEDFDGTVSLVEDNDCPFIGYVYRGAEKIMPEKWLVDDEWMDEENEKSDGGG